MFTFKLPKEQKPLSINDKNELTLDHSFPVYQASSLNEIAEQLISGSLIITGALQHKAVLSRLDFNDILNKEFIESVSENQNLTSQIKLIPLNKYASSFSIRSGRPVRLYFRNKNLVPDVSASDVDLYHVVRIPHRIADYIGIEDKVVACSDEMGRIYEKEAYTIVDRADEAQLNENLNDIDTDKYAYFIAK